MLNWYNPCVFLYQQNVYYSHAQFYFSNLFVSYKTMLILLVTLFYFFFKKNVTVACAIFYNIGGVIIVDFAVGTQNNFGLINSLSVWHPFNFLIATAVFIAVFIFKTNYLYIVLLVSVIFLLLGSWWSSQEILWYGWWNWDGVENSLLFVFILLFMCTHNFVNRRMFFITTSALVFYMLLYFCILNKTNVFKSIHSFSNSTVAYLSPILFLPILTYTIYIFLKFHFNIIFWYFLIKWVLFYISLILLYSNIFLNLNFFFNLNVILLLFTIGTWRIYAISLLCYLLVPNVYLAILIPTTIIFVKLRLVSLSFIHNTLVLTLIFFVYMLIKSKFTYFSLYVQKYTFLENNLFANNYVLSVKHNKTISYGFVHTNITNIYKNYLYIMNNHQYDFTSNTLLTHKNSAYLYTNTKLFILCLVTKVYYLIQKPRYNYYI